MGSQKGHIKKGEQFSPVHQVTRYTLLLMALIVVCAATFVFTPKDAFAATVSVPIVINAKSGSDTLETGGVAATVTCTGGGGTHDGNAASQSFTCNESVTVTVIMPTDAATSLYRFSDGSTTKSFTSCAAPGPCSATTYNDVTRVLTTDPTLAGLDTNRIIKVTRTVFGTTSTETFSGSGDQLLVLNGASMYARAAANTVFNVTTGDFSMWGYIYRTSDSGGVEVIAAKRDFSATTNPGYGVYINTSDQLEASLCDGSTTRIIMTITSPTVALNTHYLWAVSYDRDGNGNIYLYNVATDTLTTASTAISAQQLTIGNSQIFTMGRAPQGSSNFLAGRLDTTSVLLGTAISSTQVTALTKGEYIPPTSRYKFDEGSGTTGTDAVGGNNLTLSGTPTWTTKIKADQSSIITYRIVQVSSSQRYATGSTTTVSAASTPTITYYTQWNQTASLSGLDAQTIQVTRVVNGSSGTQNAGPTSTTNIWVDDGSTMSFEDPKVVTINQERYDTGSTSSFSNIQAAATRSATYFHQYAILTTLSGLDVAQTNPVTRTQLGVTNIDSVIGHTATVVWNDASATYTVPATVTISSTERFQSYNTTGQRSFAVSAYAAKTYIFNHEYELSSMTFLTSDGTSLITAPTSFTFTMSNGTALTSISGTWAKNGTATISAITWRGINVTPTANTIAITSGGDKSLNTNIAESVTPGIQLGTDGGVLTGLSWDSVNKQLTFTGTATGTKDTVVQYPVASFVNVQGVTVDGTAHTDFTDDNTNGIMTINDVSFSAHTIIITFSGPGGTAPTQIAPDTLTVATDYEVFLDTNATYVKFGSNFYADQIDVYGTRVEFTNIALIDAANPTQTFGIGMGSGNTTITEITSGAVVLTMSCTEGTQCNVQYYTASSTAVYNVHFNTGAGASTVTDIESSTFTTSASAFASASAPAVYFNSAGRYYEVKLTYTDPTLVTLYLTPQTGGGGGGGGGGPPDPDPDPDPTPDPNPTQSFTISAVLPSYTLQPGMSQQRIMTITVTGTTQIFITSLTFVEHAEWFTINKQLPFSAIMDENNEIKTDIPITLTLPATETTDAKQFNVILATSNGASEANVQVPILITTPAIQFPELPQVPEIPNLPPILSGPPFNNNVWNLATIFGVLLLGGTIVGAARKKGKLKTRR